MFEEEKKKEQADKLKFKRVNLRIEMPKIEYKMEEDGQKKTYVLYLDVPSMSLLVNDKF